MRHLEFIERLIWGALGQGGVGCLSRCVLWSSMNFFGEKVQISIKIGISKNKHGETSILIRSHQEKIIDRSFND